MTTRSGAVTDPAALECRDLSRSYGDRLAVDGVSFRVARGETFGLLGPNGAGKTTTISMAVGILEPDAGEVLVAGRSLDRAARAHIGVVPQEIALYPDLSARENLSFFGRLYGLTGRTLDDRIDTVLEVVGLQDRGGDRVETYSGGMQRRLNIAAGMLHDPRLLVLDEPTVGVDPQSRNAILEAVETLGRDGLSVLYTTHYMEEAERLCDRLAILDHGRVIAEGTRRELVGRMGERDRVVVGIEGDVALATEDVRTVAAVSEVSVEGHSLDVLVADARGVLPELIAAASRRATVTAVEVHEPNLEAVFLHLTGRALRD
ncbi:MAG: ABC transporter ATP-binding protein [Actinobacteria bacterium]|nr:ABC transporter ATP-binding protein [Actinomycetota bacterium]